MLIHQLLRLTRPLFVLDEETTGANIVDARIIEIGFQMWNADGLQKEWRMRVNPGIPIPPESTEIHHITDAMVTGCRTCGKPANEHIAPELWPKSDDPDDFPCAFNGWPVFGQLAESLARGFQNCDFAGKHVRFDLRVLAAEMQRENIAWSYAGARIIDADRLEQLGEPRTLSHLYRKHLGKDPDDAHEALADVRMTTEIIQVQLQKYDTLPRDLDQLHELQWPNWIDGEGKFRFVNGVPCVGQWGKHALKPMKDVPRDYWDFILKPKSEFAADVKALASAAKLGQFPVAPTPSQETQ